MVLARILLGGVFTSLVCFSLGRLFLRKIPAAKVMALPVGAALLSLCVYGLLSLGLADTVPFVTLGVAALVAAAASLRPRFSPGSATPYKTATVRERPSWLLITIFGAYTVFYAVHTLAPEIQPDALGYHLGLVSEYFRTGSFASRIDFYNILPQGMEMLYLFAFTIGRHPAAKLVHFAFLLATPAVMLAIGRQLGISDRVSWIAAALYFCAPVAGISGTSAYTDAALVCATLAVFYFLLAWREEGQARYLLPAGLLAGFCYAIKVSSIIVPALGGLFVLFECRRSLRLAIERAALFAASALAMIAPWMGRAAALTGNPLAPLFNAWFPNPYFLVVTDKALNKFMHTYDGFTYRHAAWELTGGGASHGIVGPVFLLLPIGLFALRSRAGRWIWLAGGLLALPWLSNNGTRFLMPALPFFALALALALPRPVAWIVLAAHAVLCWPTVLAHYERPGLWRLCGFPWRAALRLDSDRAYLRAALGDYPVAEMINTHTRPESRILGLATVANAYIDREVVQHWQSELGTRLRETILEAAYTGTYPLYEWTATWPTQPLRAVRLRTLASGSLEWEIHEASFLANGERIGPEQAWEAAAWPNLFEAPYALDHNQATRWRSWEPVRPGMYFETDFAAPRPLEGVTVSAHWDTAQIEIFGLAPNGKWRLLANRMTRRTRPKENLRRESMRPVKAAGLDYIVTPVAGSDGGVWLGKDLEAHAAEYGITEVARAGDMRLYHVDVPRSNVAVLGP